MPIVTNRSAVILDTSAVNAIYDDPSRDKRMNQLLNIYFPLLTFTVLDEVFATSNTEENRLLNYRRTQLFETTLRMQQAGNCLLPFHYLFINHVRAFVGEGRYDWTFVNCYGNKLREAIVEERHGLSDQVIQEQRKQQVELEKEYKRKFKDIRERVKDDERWNDRFRSLEDFMRFGFGEEGPYWREAIAHMKKALQILVEEEQGRDPSDAKIIMELKDAENRLVISDAKRFAETSPPFKAHLYGIACSAYARVHDPTLNSKERDRSAGRIDTFTALYLPYCRHFVTNDSGQFDCHRRVASMLGSATSVYMYEDFWKSLP